jgi:hypothetical protein
MAYKVDLDTFARRCDRLGGDLKEAAVRGLRSAAYRLEGITVEMINEPNTAEGVKHPPVDTGELMRSIRTTLVEDGAIVSVDAPHAPFMEYGTRPHYPPIDPIAGWVYRKGMADDWEDAQRIAMLICKTIARWGINPRHYMARSVRARKSRGFVRLEIARELAKIKKG